MKNLTILPQNIVFAKEQELLTDSMTVARIFNKAHKHVLARIDELSTQVIDSFYKPNFRLLEKTVKSNLGIGSYQTRMYELTKNGFMLLVMGFSGKEAMALKVAYIEEFDRMRAQLNHANSTVLKELLTTIENEKQSFNAASIAAKIMRKRRDEKIANAAKIEVYTQQLQPLLDFKG